MRVAAYEGSPKVLQGLLCSFFFFGGGRDERALSAWHTFST